MAQAGAGLVLPACIGFLMAAFLLLPVALAAKSISGYPVPRFVTLGAAQVNVRAGPSTLHPIKWQYVRFGLPVEVIAETEEWRLIRDSEGSEGWVFRNLLDGQRRVLVRGDGSGLPVALRKEAHASAVIIAVLQPGAVLELGECRAAWCRLEAHGLAGWVHRSLIWGVYPEETTP